MQKYKDVILVATGSFSPISTGHVRLMELAYEKLKTQFKEPITKLLFSPVHEAYTYKKVIPSEYRIEMIKLAYQNSKYRKLFDINYDEVLNKSGYLPTYQVMLNLKNKYHESRIIVIGGADFLAGMANMQYWPQDNVEKLFSAVSVVIFSREYGNGSMTREKLERTIQTSFLKKYAEQIQLVDVNVSSASSTDIRNGNLEYLFDNVKKYIFAQHVQLK